MKELSERLGNLLEQSVEDYIKTAVPISSAAVCKTMKRAKSPATIRNDLKILEELGYLKQVHTSGGRVPTTQGYRTYVNSVMSNLNIKPGELSFAAEQISGRVTELPSIIDEICTKLSSAFSYPIIVKQQFDNLVVNDVKVVPLVAGSTMVLIKTSAGSINQTINTDMPLTDAQCEDAAAALNTRCIGLTLREMIAGLPKMTRELKKNLTFFETLCKSLSEKLETVIERNLSRRVNVIKLLDLPDYADIEKVKKLGAAIENDQTINQVLSQTDSVVIGAEVQLDDLAGSSVIKFDYKIGGERIASVGILGPERMDYKALIGALYALLSTTVENRKLTGGKSPPLRITNEE